MPFFGGFTVVGGVVMLVAPSAWPRGPLAAELLGIGLAAAGAVAILRLRGHNRHLASVADGLPAIVFLQNERGICTYVNRRWCEFTAKPAEEALGYGFQALVHPEDARRTRPIVASAQARGVAHDVELRYRFHDETWKWLLVEVVPLRDERGTIYAWLGTARENQEQFEAALQLDNALNSARRTAASLQQALLPPALPTVPGIDFAATYRAETSEGQIGGDWYDVFVLPDGQLALSIGDVAGHGLDAAALMIRMRETLRTAAVLEGGHPHLILAAANRTASAMTGGVFATAAFAVLDPRTLRLLCASAGHPWPRLLRGEQVSELSHGGLPLGVLPEAGYTLDETYLEPGDRLVLFTDGLIEATRDVIEGERRLTSALISGIVAPDALVDYVAGAQRHDDVAVLTMTVADKYPLLPGSDPAWRFFSNDASTAAPARASLTAYLRKRRVPLERISAVEVIFGELVGNVVRHAPGPIEVELFWSDEIPALVVRDRGRGFVPSGKLPDLMDESGRGLFLIAEHGGQLFVMPRHGGGSDAMVLLPVLSPQPAESAV